MADALIIDAVRTPLGRGRPSGALAGVHQMRAFVTGGTGAPESAGRLAQASN